MRPNEWGAAVLVGLGAMAGAMAAVPTPVFPWGKFPDNVRDVNSFCDAQQAIMENSLLTLLPPEFTSLLPYLAPEMGDINGTSYVLTDAPTFWLNGNGMLDCSIELKLIEMVLKDTAFNIPAHDGYTGLSYAKVRAAFDHNDAQFNLDVGTYWLLFAPLANGVQQVLLGHMCIGDGDAVFSEPVPGTDPVQFNRVDMVGSGGFVEAIGYVLKTAGLITNPITLSNYTRMPEFFSKFGDADGDGCSNEDEYRYYAASNYVANALNPSIHPYCFPPCGLRISSVVGGGWYEAGTPLTLSVEVRDATGPVTYQWSKDGAPISDATENEYRIQEPTPYDSGTYLCTATDQSKMGMDPKECKATVDTGPIVVTIFPEGSLSTSGLAGIAFTLSMVLAAGGWAIVRTTRRG